MTMEHFISEPTAQWCSFLVLVPRFSSPVTMRISRFFVLSTWALLLGLLTVAHGKSICENKNTTRPILCVGMLRKHLLLVTVPEGKRSTQYVYELPVDSLNATLDRLYISTQPEKLEEKWPVLYHNWFYGNATFGNHIYNSFTAIDSESEYLLLTTQNGKTNLEGVVYDIDNNKAFKGLMYTGLNEQVLISSNELDHFYAITIGEDKGLRIMRYHFSEKTVKASVARQQDAIVPDTPGPEFHKLCQVGEDSLMMILSNSNSTCKPLTWPLTKGFVSEGKMYLFGGDQIYIFSKSFYQEVNKPVKVATVKYADFIQCNVDVLKKDKTGLSLGVTIGIILTVLIALLCLVLFCTREVVRRKRKKHKKKNKHGKMEEEPEPAGSIFSFFGPSVRSAEEMANPGKLSKVNSNQLSNVNSQASIRSGNVSNLGGKLSLAKGRNSVRSGSTSKLTGKLSHQGGADSAVFSNAATGRSGLSTANSKGGKASTASAASGTAVLTARSSMSKVKNSRA